MEDENIIIPQEIEPEIPVFFNQWTNRPKVIGQVFTEPTCTIPDQTMTIQEIIARFTRTGLVPQSYAKRDQGGNEAEDPGFDPLDEYSEIQATAARLQAEKAAAEKADQATDSAPAPAGA